MISFNLFKSIELNKVSNRLVLLRLKHRNHPGHKPKPLAVPVRPNLPDNYVEEAIYPPVKPKFPPGSFDPDYDTKLAWMYFEDGQKYTSLKTIQERLSVLAYLNVQQTLDDLKQRKTRFFPIYQISSIPKTPRSLPFNQYITKTHLELVEDLPKITNPDTTEKNQLNNSIDFDLYEKIKYKVTEAILHNYSRENELEDTTQTPVHPDTYKPLVIEKEKQLEKEYSRSNLLTKEILNTITSILSTNDSNKHLLNAQYGTNVNIKSYWKRCGFEEERPRGAVFPDPDCIRFQFEDIASYQIKTDMPLKPLYNLNDSACSSPKVKEYVYNPSNFKIFANHILPMQVPGHWYGDTREFNYLTVFNTTKMLSYLKDKYPNYDADLEGLQSMAINCGHAELTSQAYYLGFSMWKDLTYPLLGQFMFTNGQDYAFSNYQLNTIRLWNKATPVSNLCYFTQPKRLFEINQERTKLTEFNDTLFKNILNLLTIRPITQDTDIGYEYSELDHMIGGTRLRPYLSIQNFEKQLTNRHKLFAISLYELVKYDKPTNYLNLRSNYEPMGFRPKFQRLYDKYTYEYRDIVLNYYPRDFYGFQLVDRMLKKAPKQTSKFWDLKHPVYEWANVPPPDTNNIPRNIQLPQF